MVNHLRDHLLNYYMTEAHRGVELATKNGMIEQNAAQEMQVIARVQALIEQELASFTEMLPAIAEEAKKYAPPPPPADPSMAVAQLNAQLQEKLAGQKAQIDQQKLQLDEAKLQQAPQLANAKITSDMQREQMRQEAENQRTQAELQARIAMNTADNDTAKMIVAAEIQTGERTALSTGTGINP